MTSANDSYVLIVDDDPRNRRLLESLLASEGYRTKSAASGGESLAVIATQTPALILLDLMMPGMDGFEVVRRLRASDVTRDLPIVVVTAVDDAGSRARLAGAGVVDVIAKPVDRWALRTCLDQFLGKAR